MPAFPSAEWANSATAALEADAQFQRTSRAFDATIRFDFGEAGYALSVDEGAVELHEDPTFVTWDFALRGERDTWEAFLAETPPPLSQDLLGLWLRGPLTMEGDLKTAIQHLQPLKRLLVVFREVANE